MGYRDDAFSLQERLASLARERERLEEELAAVRAAVADARQLDERRRSGLARTLESLEGVYRSMSRGMVATLFAAAMALVIGFGAVSAVQIRSHARERLRREIVTDELFRNAPALESTCLQGASAGLDATASVLVTARGTVERAVVRTRSRALEDESRERNDCLEGVLRSLTLTGGRKAMIVEAKLRLAPRSEEAR